LKAAQPGEILTPAVPQERRENHMPRRQPPARRRANWHDRAFFGIHYDQHAHAGDVDFAGGLTAEHLRRRLRQTRPDWIQCDCKGHVGYTSWPTEVGSTCPGLAQDQLRIYRDVTRQLGIPLGLHYCGLFERRAGELHPDWSRIDADGRRDTKINCMLGPYLEELMIPQLVELIDKYDPDGFWIDGDAWAAVPCWCDRCRAEFARRGGAAEAPTAPDQPGWGEWLTFHRDVFVEYVRKYTEAIHARRPSCLVCSNWLYSAFMPDRDVAVPVDYLSGDWDRSWGADRILSDARCLAAREMSWDLMTWFFSKTGAVGDDLPWAPKGLPQLCQELAEIIALGGSVMIYDQPQRDGRLGAWRNRRLAAAGRFARARQEVCWKSRPVAQAAVLHLAEHFYRHNQPLYQFGRAMENVAGALHVLTETQRSVEVLAEGAALRRMKQFRLVVAAELTCLSGPMRAALEAYARGGGRVVLSGAHVAGEYGELAGARPDGPPTVGTCLLPAGDETVGCPGPWQPVTCGDGCQPVALRQLSQDPGERPGPAVATLRRLGRGAVLAIHGPIFQSYFRTHYPALRRAIAEMIGAVGTRWDMEVAAPPHVELVLRRKGRRLLVNLINRAAAQPPGPQRIHVEDIPPARNITVRIRCRRRPKSVTLEPAARRGAPARKLRFSWSAGWATVNLPRLDIHVAVVVG